MLVLRVRAENAPHRQLTMQEKGRLRAYGHRFRPVEMAALQRGKPAADGPALLPVQTPAEVATGRYDRGGRDMCPSQSR
jgi:hypothetical protein